MSRNDPTSEQKLDMTLDALIPSGDKSNKGNKNKTNSNNANSNKGGNTGAPNGKAKASQSNANQVENQGQPSPSAQASAPAPTSAPRSEAKKQKPVQTQQSDTDQQQDGNENNEQQFGDESYNNESTSRVLKISANSNPKTVAGAISHTSRQGECPSMLATGASSINQAIKALAIARDYLEENKIDINCYPESRPETRNGMLFRLVKTVRRQGGVEKDVQQMKVSKNSKPASVAGAIANKLREGQRVCVLAIGADSVLHCVQAISLGRKYLEQDALDISFRPEFTKVQFDESEERIAIKFVVNSQQI